MGAFAVFLGLVTSIFLKEPTRKNFVKSKQPEVITEKKSKFTDSLKSIWKLETARYITIAGSLRSFGGMAVAAYAPVFY
jgi:hypothetical protein